MVVMVVFLVIYNVLWRLAAGTMMTLAASCKLCPRISFEFLPHYFDCAWLSVTPACGATLALTEHSLCVPMLSHQDSGQS